MLATSETTLSFMQINHKAANLKSISIQREFNAVYQTANAQKKTVR